MNCISLVKLTDNHHFFSCFASLFAEDAEEKAKKEAEESVHQGTDEKKTDEKDEKPTEDDTAAKMENSKEPNPGENKSSDSNENSHVNGTGQTGVTRHEASQGKSAPRTDKGMDSHHTVREEKHVQNGEFSPSNER